MDVLDIYFFAGDRSQLSNCEVHSSEMCAESPEENGEQKGEKVVNFLFVSLPIMYRLHCHYAIVISIRTSVVLCAEILC